MEVYVRGREPDKAYNTKHLTHYILDEPPYHLHSVHLWGEQSKDLKEHIVSILNVELFKLSSRETKATIFSQDVPIIRKIQQVLQCQTYRNKQFILILE